MFIYLRNTPGFRAYEEEMSLTYDQALTYINKNHLINRIVYADPFDLIFIAKCFIVKDFIKDLKELFNV